MSTGPAESVPGLAAWLDRPPTAPDAGLLEAVEAGPCDPALALPMARMDRLLDPAPLEVETGWCRLADGTGFVAARVDMPGVTPEMVDWWFDWHPRRSERYRVWHPQAHIGVSMEAPAEAGAKPFWGAVHDVAEDVGTGPVRARIEFLPPTRVGFSSDSLDDARVGTIVCGFVGDRWLRNSVMCHVWLRQGDGLVLRSHFWLGAAIGPRLPEGLSWLGRTVAGPLNCRFVRQRALPDQLLKCLDRHCVEEYTNLAAILPSLHREFASG